MHACEICHKEFSRQSGLQTHMNTHTNVQPYGCPFPNCGRVFNVRSNAKRHLKTHFYRPPPPAPVQITFVQPVVAGSPPTSSSQVHHDHVHMMAVPMPSMTSSNESTRMSSTILRTRSTAADDSDE
ncbi:hypothetical protein R3P38DRAFT_1114596 [Favolaschia claudopus]|uniref:C2H2-type domain-containing protein n=1 Tax=Favolaschia claudopus TaxID=2862362 RepID=A0AAW0BBJ0_9AGAR